MGYATRGQTSPGAYPHLLSGNNEKDPRRYLSTITLCNNEYRFTFPAGHYESNTFGLYDMTANARALQLSYLIPSFYRLGYYFIG